MLFTSLSFRWVDETAAHRVNYDPEMNRTRLLGMLDDNLDGRIEKAELKGKPGAMIAKYFDVIDKNHDGVIDADELAAAQSMLGGPRRASLEGNATAPTPPAGGR